LIGVEDGRRRVEIENVRPVSTSTMHAPTTVRCGASSSNEAPKTSGAARMAATVTLNCCLGVSVTRP